MTISFDISKPLADYGRELREWAVSALRPHAREADTAHQPPANWREILASCPVPIGSPQIQDGAPMPTFDEGYWVSTLVVYENMTYGDLWATPRMSNGLGALVVKGMGTPRQVEQWYTPTLETREIGAFALTEPGFGSDTSRVETTATRDGDSWILNGSKMYCTQGADATFVVAFATVDKSLGGKGISAFVVPAGTPGFTVVKPNEDKLGITSWTTSELLFVDCAIPLENRLGFDEQGNQVSATGGQSGALAALSANRPNMAMMAIALAEASLDITEPLLRQQRGSFSPSRWETVERSLAEMRLALERGRRICFKAQWAVDRGDTDRAWAAMGKGFSPETCERVIRRCMQLLGPEGTSKELLLEKWYRDVKIMDIFEGSGQIQRLVVGRSLMGRAAG